MDSRIDEFRKYLVNLERSPSTIESYTRAVRQFFGRYEELNKENMIDFKHWQMGLNKPKTAALRVHECLLRICRQAGVQG